MYYYGKEGEYRALVMVSNNLTFTQCVLLLQELLGPSLDELFVACGRKFSVQTVLALADQLIARMESIHQQGLVFRDVKPDNFLMGKPAGKASRLAYVIDFGLSLLSLPPERCARRVAAF